MVALIVWIVVIGVIAWLINSYVPIPQPFKTLINIVLIVVALLLILNAFGLTSGGLPRVR